jgi:alcohol dehydrogenase (cytochrome c)
VWTTGSFDPELNLTYWGTGNPWPDFTPAQRPGDNLYSDSVVALDADTGKLKWHFQFTPHDPYDYDSTQIPILIDGTWNGKPTKLMFFANRNGFFYVFDRATGKFLSGRPYTTINWASGLDQHGRPVQTPQPPDRPTIPSMFGATNWYSPSYSPRTGLFYVSAWENSANLFDSESGRTAVPIPGMTNPASPRRGHVNTWTDALGTGAVIALDPHTGEQKWKLKMYDVNTSGILTTASDLLFVGGREGYFHALDARTGTVLWKITVGWHTTAGPMTYEVAGKQYVAISAGRSVFVFGLRD